MLGQLMEKLVTYRSTLCDQDWIYKLNLNIILFVTHCTPSHALLFVTICSPLSPSQSSTETLYVRSCIRPLEHCPAVVVLWVQGEDTARTLKSIKRTLEGHWNPSRGHWKDIEIHQEDTERTPRGHWNSSWVRIDRQYEEEATRMAYPSVSRRPAPASTVKVLQSEEERQTLAEESCMWKPFRSGCQPLKWTCTVATSPLVCISILNLPTPHLTWFESTM